METCWGRPAQRVRRRQGIRSACTKRSWQNGRLDLRLDEEGACPLSPRRRRARRRRLKDALVRGSAQRRRVQGCAGQSDGRCRQGRQPVVRVQGSSMSISLNGGGGASLSGKVQCSTSTWARTQSQGSKAGRRGRVRQWDAGRAPRKNSASPQRRLRMSSASHFGGALRERRDERGTALVQLPVALVRVDFATGGGGLLALEPQREPPFPLMSTATSRLPAARRAARAPRSRPCSRCCTCTSPPPPRPRAPCRQMPSSSCPEAHRPASGSTSSCPAVGRRWALCELVNVCGGHRRRGCAGNFGAAGLARVSRGDHKLVAAQLVASATAAARRNGGGVVGAADHRHAAADAAAVAAAPDGVAA